MAEAVPGVQVDELLREAGWIRALARGLSDGAEPAGELEQETWLAALRARPAGGGLRPWLAVVMRNLARARSRGEAHRLQREREHARAEALPSAQALVERADLQRELVAAVLALEDPYRSVVLLRFYEGLSPSEIARRQGVPAGSVRARLSRGVQQLRERLDRRCGGDRSRWMAAIAPASLSWSSWKAVIVVKKLAWGLALLLAASLGWHALQRQAGRSESPAVALVPPAGPVSVIPGTTQPVARGLPETQRVALTPARADVPGRTRVRVIDERTEEPVPEFAVALVDALPASSAAAAQGQHGVFRSDAAGELDLPLAPGERLRLDLPELASAGDLIQTRASTPPASRVEFEAPAAGASAPRELRVSVGPSYRLNLKPPPGHALDTLKVSLRSGDPRQAFDVARAGVRAGELPWVRFASSAYLVAGGPPWRMEVESSDGLWHAQALVEEREGRARQPVRLEFEPRARVFGILRDVDGAPVPRAVVQLAPAPGQEALGRTRFASSDSEGRWEFRATPPGAWRLRLRDTQRAPAERELTLGALQALEVDLALVAAAPGELARLEVLVESSSGRFDDAVYITISRPGAGGFGGRASWTEVDGHKQGRFLSEELARGSYTIDVRVPGMLEVEPAQRQVDAGGEPARFLVRDDVETVEWHVRARAGDEPLADFRVELSSGLEQGRRSTAATAKQGLVSFRNLPRGKRCEFMLRAAGFRPVWGVVTFDGSTRAEQPLEVALNPGWGTEVSVLDAQRKPLAGARLSFDGSFAASTDERGHARIALEREPSSVRVEYLDWKLAPGNSIAPDTGRFRTWEPFLVVVLEP